MYLKRESSLSLKPPQIIGGGTAGLTVAARLAEDPKLSVAVVEGGGFYELDNGNISQIPAYDVQYSGSDPSTIQPTVDWGIVTAPQMVRFFPPNLYMVVHRETCQVR